MKYFSGFCLENEKELFKEYLEEKKFVVAGFSKGAQDAVEFALNSTTRIDKLQLLSPAFFDYQKKIINLNLNAFRKDKNKYIKNFLTKAGFSNVKLKKCTEKELEKLFYFNWEKIKKLNNIKIEIFLGERDKIISLKKAYEFFSKVGEVYLIKNANHFLRS